MKKFKYFILLFIVFVSCEEFLKEEPKALISNETFYKTYDHCVAGIASAYAELREDDDKSSVVYVTQMPTDLEQGDDNSWLWTSTAHPGIPYSEYYLVINEANVTIENVTQNADEINSSLLTSGAPAAIKALPNFDAAKMFEGEARFIRALMYFSLVNFYGDVPLILKSSLVELPEDLVRAPKDTVFAQIRRDLKFAIEYCATKAELIEGRATKAAAAGLLAKVDIYYASIIRRDAKYWNKNILPAAPANMSDLQSKLYAEAEELCTRIINREFGNYSLDNYYVKAATGSLYANEHLFAIHSLRGNSTQINLHGGWPGDRGSDQTHYAQFIFDLPTWEEQYNSPAKIYGLGMALNDTLIHRTAANPAGDWSPSGDTTRRLWSCLVWRGNPDEPRIQYWSVYEPIARNAGDKFFIPVGLGGKPYDNYAADDKEILLDNNGDWSSSIWCAAGRTLYDAEIWRINDSPTSTSSGKYRLKFPYPADFSAGDYQHTYPVLRTAEIYLLRAEARFFRADMVLTTDAIADIDVVRERAQNQASIQQLMLNHGDATPIIKASTPQLFRDVLPANMSGNAALKVLLDERFRELSNENCMRWFDMVRFPEVILPNIHEMNFIEQPLKTGIDAGDNYYTTSYIIADRFSVEKNLYMVYFPIPPSEMEFYPGLKQTYGYPN